MRNLYKINLLLFLFLGYVYCSGGGDSGGIKLFKFDFGPVATPFVVCMWVLLASLAKIGFHYSEFISNYIPESCMLIALGVPIGFIMQASGITDGGEIILTSELFFFYLLPPIILDAGYFMPSNVFYLNIGTILLYAILGTIFNAFAVGASLFGVADICNLKEFNLLKGLLFGSLISAVDPVAVLAVFEEVHVHEILYMLVFGESVLNDAASVVLYRTFESLVKGEVTFEQVGLAIASFFIVSIGGTLIGIMFALLTSFITKYTEHVRVIEPAFVFLMAYMAYLSAEVFHFSGIMAILFCGIVMKPYVESNVSRKSHTTIKYFLKLLSSSCESIIFMLFGVSLVLQLDGDSFNWGFICFTLLFITIYRAVGVITLTALANKFGRLTKVKKVEQFIMVYGGLRGAVAYSLAIVLEVGNKELKSILITTTMCIVLFTTVIQGSTIKKLVQWLGVRKAPKDDKTMAQTLNDRVMGYVTAGVEEIIGVHRHAYWRIKIEDWNKRYFRRWFERDPDLALDEEILAMQRKIAFKHALNYANNPSMITARESDEQQLTMVKRNASFALELAMKAQETSMECGILDINILSDRATSQQGSEAHSEAFNPRSIACLIPKAKRTGKRNYAKRKYTLDSLGEKESFEDRYLKYKRNALSHMAPREANQSLRHRHHNHANPHKSHRHHRKHRKGKSKKPEMDTLPELTETDDTVIDMNRISRRDLIKNEKEKCSSESSSSDDDEEDGGIMFSPKSRGDTLLLQNEYIPALPLSDTPVHSNLYVSSAVLDDRSKNLSQRDFEDIKEATKWQHYPLSSQESLVGDMKPQTDVPDIKAEVAVEIQNPWQDPPPPYADDSVRISGISADETTF